ncbi:MAG: hypothetical protein AAGD25_30755 [Cyanobacteria bacterium P01_F01_bin.150]
MTVHHDHKELEEQSGRHNQNDRNVEQKSCRNKQTVMIISRLGHCLALNLKSVISTIFLIIELFFLIIDVFVYKTLEIQEQRLLISQIK